MTNLTGPSLGRRGYRWFSSLRAPTDDPHRLGLTAAVLSGEQKMITVSPFFF